MSLYNVAVPTLKRTLGSLSAILNKAAEQASERGIEETTLINARLAPDMFPLSRQVQIATDSARRGAGELAGVDIPSMADTETTFAELQTRISMTIDFLDSLSPEQFEGAAERAIELPMPDGTLKLDGTSFLMGFALSNFYFHAVTCYDILRHNGITIGKMDFLGSP